LNDHRTQSRWAAYDDSINEQFDRDNLDTWNKSPPGVLIFLLDPKWNNESKQTTNERRCPTSWGGHRRPSILRNHVQIFYQQGIMRESSGSIRVCIMNDKVFILSSSFFSSIPQHIIHILGTATGVLGKYFVLQRAKNPPFSTLWDARPLGSSN
jgi:hypothetical protein